MRYYKVLVIYSHIINTKISGYDSEKVQFWNTVQKKQNVLSFFLLYCKLLTFKVLYELLSVHETRKSKENTGNKEYSEKKIIWKLCFGKEKESLTEACPPQNVY